MRAVVQRVAAASVTVGGEETGGIDRGLVVLVAVASGDGGAEAGWLAEKVVGLRIFGDEEGKMNRSVLDVGGAVLLVSQFTLYGDTRKGKRPSFVGAAQGQEARSAYEDVASRIRNLGVVCETGTFGAEMQVSLVNDGPVTILLDSDKTF